MYIIQADSFSKINAHFFQHIQALHLLKKPGSSKSLVWPQLSYTSAQTRAGNDHNSSAHLPAVKGSCLGSSYNFSLLLWIFKYLCQTVIPSLTVKLAFAFILPYYIQLNSRGVARQGW